MRLDHSIKNVFVLPGLVIPLTYESFRGSLPHILIGFTATILIASGNYVLNEILDASCDAFHPKKSLRAAAQGQVNPAAACVLWLALFAAGILLGGLISRSFAIMLLALWAMGCLYNIPPIRTKEIAYLDVLSEAVNNPIRFLLGWYMITDSITPPVSLLISYWMMGCYFMGLKRFSELRDFICQNRDPGLYRRSFNAYTVETLLISVIFYASASMLFLGAFIMRYHLELVLAFPFIALTMALYFWLAFQPDSVVQSPEKIYTSAPLLGSVLLTSLVMLLLFQWHSNSLQETFAPTHFHRGL
jgi:decaprenyl-phosphate phosphoribosyltransferase